MVKRLVISFVVLALAACSNTIPQTQSVSTLNLEVNPALLDPALQGQDREDMETILRLLPTSLREDVSFIDMESDKAYDSLLQARGLSYSAKDLGNNVFESQSGVAFSMPQSSLSDTTFSTQTTRASVSDCADAKSGPMRRVSTLLGNTNRPVNWLQTTVYLPNSFWREAGGFLERLKDSSGNTIKLANGKDRLFTNGPFIYLGGWGNGGKTAVDVGFQLSTGDYNNQSNGLWTLVARAEGVGKGKPAVFFDVNTNKPSDPLDQINVGDNGKNQSRKFEGGQRIKLNFWNYDHILVISALGLDNAKARTIAFKLPAGSGWNGSGIGNIYKMMTTIGQTAKGVDTTTNLPNGEGERLQGEGYLSNVLWSDTSVGYFQVPAKVSDWPAVIQNIYAANKNDNTKVDYKTDALIQIPPVDNGGSMTPALTNACRFPDPNKMSDIKYPFQWNPAGIFVPDEIKYVVQVKGATTGNENPNVFDPTGECVSVDLRTPATPTFLQDFFGLSAWVPPVPNCARALTLGKPLSQSGSISSQAIVVVPADLIEPQAQSAPVILTGTVGQSPSKTYYLSNIKGAVGSSMRYRIYPIGQNLSSVTKTALDTRKFVIRDPSKAGVSGIRFPNAVPNPAGTDPFSSSLAISIDGKLRQPLTTNPAYGELQKQLDISGTCSSVGTFTRGFLLCIPQV